MAADGTGVRGRRALRVFMTADTLGGTWTYAIELARALGDLGYVTALATMGRMPDRAQRRMAAGVPGLELHASAYRLLWMRDPWSDVEAAGEWLQALCAQFAPDVVHLNDLGHGHLSWPAPVVSVVHSCVLSWWRAVHRDDAPAEWGAYACRVRRGLDAAQAVVAPTQAMLDEARRRYGPLRAARVISDARTIAGAGKTQRIPIVLSVGRLWDEAKNVASLAAAASRLPWPVLVAGADDSPDGQSRSFANVTRLGFLGERTLQRLYARAAIYALPARYEPFGLSVLEAAGAGCALVLGDIPSLRENWDGAAAFVEPDDTDALEWHLQRVIRDESLRSRLSAAAAARAAQPCFHPRTMASAYADTYAQVIARRRVRHSRGTP